jgi:hypothetical protein
MDLTRVFRIVLRALPAALLLAGLAQLVAAFLAWGAAEHVEIPAWETTVVGVCFALPAIGLGLVSLRGIWQSTREQFSPAWLLLIPGAFALLLAITIIAALASVIADPATYDNLRDDDGTINTSPAGFLFIGLFAALALACGVALPVFLYGAGVTPDVKTKFDRQPDEYDAMAEMMRGRRGPRVRP